LRLASAAPSGSSWARVLREFDDEVERETNAQVRFKFYLSGVAGTEMEMAERIRRGQLDGAVSGGAMCEEIMPSIRIHSVPGLVVSRAEAAHVNALLRPELTRQASQSGFVLLATAGLGPEIFFTRIPIRTLAELRRTPLWIWELRPDVVQVARALGLNVLPASVNEGSRVYEQHRVDGFVSMPLGALAFQWNTQVKYFTDLRLGFTVACMVVANRAFDRLPFDAQQKVRAAAAKLMSHTEDVGQREDRELLERLFQQQGLRAVPASESFRAEFFDAIRDARTRLGDQFVPASLVNRVTQYLLDYRAEHDRR
jgi:TRAP-type C4-dicarboxylate transport system substrate-binding protein